MGEDGCLKDAKFKFFESVGPAKIGNDLEVDGTGIYNNSLYVKDTLTCGFIHKGYLYSTIENVVGILDDPLNASARSPDRDPFTNVREYNGSRVEFIFDRTLPKNAVISDLSLRVIGSNASFNSSGIDTEGGTELWLGASGDIYSHAGNEEKFIKRSSFLNASSDGLEVGKTYSLIKDNIVIQSNKLRDEPVWWNSSHCFNGSYNHEINSSALLISTLLNASEETQPILVIQASGGGVAAPAVFKKNCSLQAFITYNSPYPVDPNTDGYVFNEY